MAGSKKIVALVEARGTERSYRMDDGSVEVWSGGTASWRHNNPGNLKFEFAGSADPTVHSSRSYQKALRVAQNAHFGVVALDPRGNAIFETPEAGRVAQLEVLKNRFGERTVERMVEGYSTKDYSGPTHHSAQLAMIFRTGDERGIDLRHRRIDALSPEELAVLAHGVARFEGFRPGKVNGHDFAQVGPGEPRSVAPQGRTSSRRASHSIYDEATIHFMAAPERFEYGRPDAHRPGRDNSRLERDGDGDGRMGVDCSAFVWRGLKNAGFNVTGSDASGFSTHSLFDGRTPTKYARSHFDVIAADKARQPRGTLERGDLLLFSDGHSQHVGIFKGYDEHGRLHFIGSQSSTGPREIAIEPNGYWDGRTTHIVGALRAKPEFQVRPPLHGESPLSAQAGAHSLPTAEVDASRHPGGAPPLAPVRPGTPRTDHPAHADADTTRLQNDLNDLGARDGRGAPLVEDGVFGRRTREALKGFQHDHGLPESGRIDTGSREALSSIHGLRLTDTRHPDYPLFERTLGMVESGERARGITSGMHSANIAAALVVEARDVGLQRIDRVDFGEDSRFVRAVQVMAGGGSVHERMATLETRVASSQSLHASSDMLAQLPRAELSQHVEQRIQGRSPSLAN
ncbi:XVIPCD domain-containing protein [Lysobacter xanthus]